MPALSPGQFSSTSDSKDYGTGYRTHSHDIEVPDRQQHEPVGIRSQARELSTNTWSVRTTAGPHEDRDPSGSYYRQVSATTHKGTLGSVKGVAKKAASEAWRDVMKAR